VTLPERFTIDGTVIDALMPDLVGHDRSAAAFLVYLYLWRRTRGGGRPTVVSYRMLADGTGLAKRSAQLALKHLARRPRPRRREPPVLLAELNGDAQVGKDAGTRMFLRRDFSAPIERAGTRVIRTAVLAPAHEFCLREVPWQRPARMTRSHRRPRRAALRAGT
jgi:hypothetical protein